MISVRREAFLFRGGVTFCFELVGKGRLNWVAERQKQPLRSGKDAAGSALSRAGPAIRSGCLLGFVLLVVVLLLIVLLVLAALLLRSRSRSISRRFLLPRWRPTPFLLLWWRLRLRCRWCWRWSRSDSLGRRWWRVVAATALLALIALAPTAVVVVVRGRCRWCWRGRRSWSDGLRRRRWRIVVAAALLTLVALAKAAVIVAVYRRWRGCRCRRGSRSDGLRRRRRRLYVIVVAAAPLTLVALAEAAIVVVIYRRCRRRCRSRGRSDGLRSRHWCIVIAAALLALIALAETPVVIVVYRRCWRGRWSRSDSLRRRRLHIIVVATALALLVARSERPEAPVSAIVIVVVARLRWRRLAVHIIGAAALRALLIVLLLAHRASAIVRPLSPAVDLNRGSPPLDDVPVREGNCRPVVRDLRRCRYVARASGGDRSRIDYADVIHLVRRDPHRGSAHRPCADERVA